MTCPSSKSFRSPLATNARTVVQRILDPEGKPQNVEVNLCESPILWLHARGMIDDRLFRAAEQLRSDWEAAGLGANVTMNWDRMVKVSGSAKPVPATDREICAARRFSEALDAAGHGLRDVLWRVACAGEGLGAAEKALGWPSRAGKLVLGFALDRVAKYYRID